MVHIWKVNMLTLVHKDANLQTLVSMDTVVHRKKSVLAASKLPAVFCVAFVDSIVRRTFLFVTTQHRMHEM